jgi:uncharacterized protein YejL (UPF0352 family)
VMRIVKRMSLWMTATALLALGVAYPAARAGAAEAKPVAVVSFAGYDALKKDLGFIGEISGTPELAQAAEGMLAIVTRFQGLAGLDKTKPIGAAIFLSEEKKPSGYLFIPVANLDKLLDVLQDFVIDVEDDGEGYSTFKLKNGPELTMRETKGWVYISMSKELLADVAADPATLLGDLPKRYDLAVQINIGNVPENLIEEAVAQMRAGAEQQLRRNAERGDAQAQAIAEAFTETTLESITQAIKDLQSYTLGLAIDSDTRSAYFDVQVDMKDGSRLAKQLNSAVDSAKPTTLPGLADAARVFNLHFNSPISGEDAKILTKLIDDGRKPLEENLDNEIPNEDERAVIKKAVNTVIDVAKGTLEGGLINGGAVVTGEGPFSVVAGLHVSDGKKLEAMAKDLLKYAAERNDDFPEVKFDAETKSGITYHTLQIPEIPNEEEAENFEKFFGSDEVSVGLGFGAKSVVLAISAKPIDAADGVVNGKPAKLPPKTVPLQMQLKLGPVMKLAAEQAGDKEPILKEIAESLEESDKGHINLNLTLLKNGERMRFEVEEGVIAAFGKGVKAAMNKASRGGR